MATTPVVYQCIRLNANWDPVWNSTSCLSNIDAVAQVIKQTILLFQGEWWGNLSLGTPMFQSILGGSGSQASQKAINLALTERIRSVPYVIGAVSVTSSFNVNNRAFSFSATAETAFGTVSVTVGPGVNAATGG